MITPEVLFNMDLEPVGEFIPDLLLTKFSKNVVDYKDGKDVDFSSTYVHEYTHWVQFAGTNWGAMQLVQNQEATNMLTNQKVYGMLGNTIEELKHITISEKFQIKIPPAFQRTAIFYQNWQDGFITKKIFGGGTSNMSKISSLYDSIAVGLTDYTNTINFLLGAEEISIRELENHYSFEDIIFLRFGNHGELTNHDLLEGQAKINDILHKITLLYGSKGIFDVDFNSFFNDQYPETYSKAFKIYLEIASNKTQFSDMENLYALIEECIKFCIIVDISLSIELPPFIPKHMYPHISWRKIYPPIRFANLIKAAQEIEMDFDNTLDKEKYIRYAKLLCDKAGYITPHEQALYFLEHHQSEIAYVENVLSVQTMNVSKIRGLMDYIVFLFIKFNRLRLESPEMICLPGLNGVDAKLLRLKLEEENYWLHCPFQMRGDSFGNTLPGHGNGLSGSLLGLLISNRIIEQHIIRNIPVNKIKFPFEVDSRLRGIVSNILEKKFDIILQWD